MGVEVTSGRKKGAGYGRRGEGMGDFKRCRMMLSPVGIFVSNTAPRSWILFARQAANQRSSQACQASQGFAIKYVGRLFGSTFP